MRMRTGTLLPDLDPSLEELWYVATGSRTQFPASHVVTAITRHSSKSRVDLKTGNEFRGEEGRGSSDLHEGRCRRCWATRLHGDRFPLVDLVVLGQQAYL